MVRDDALGLAEVFCPDSSALVFDGADAADMIELVGEYSRENQRISYNAGETPLLLHDQNDQQIVEFVEIQVESAGADVVLISGNVNVSTEMMSGNGSASASGGFRVFLQKSAEPTFTSPENLIETSGLAFLEVATATSAQRFGVPGSASFSFIDTAFGLPGSYYYRLLFKPQSPGVISGSFLVVDRTLNVLQLKR